MELSNEFTVSVPVDEAWAVLTDLERVAPCMPGFELQEIDGEEYRGRVKVKVGPMIAQYKGVASFQERDDDEHRAVVKAEGRDVRGQGNASALVTAKLAPDGAGTRVTMHTDLKITGKVAQFGRGVLADVSTKLLGQFVSALEADVLKGASSAGVSVAPESDTPAGPAAPATSTEAIGSAAPQQPSGPRRIESAPSEPVDLLATAGSSVMKRVIPIAVAVAVALWLLLRN